MSFDAKWSTGAKHAVAVTGSVRATLGGGFLKIYAGTVPATADAALGGATLLATYTESGDGVTGLTFAATPVAGTLPKATAETWTAGADDVNSGTASFWRWEMPGDTGGASTTEIRLQGECSLGGKSLVLNSLTFVDATPRTINSFSIALYGPGG